MISDKDILNASILIVDDQETNVILLGELLHEAGYQRISSTMEPTSVAALHAANGYDLILLDLLMPGMDGFEVMESIRSKEENDYLPVIVITAQPEHKLRALQAGAKDFISKPFDLLEIKTRIRNMLEVRLLHTKLANYNQELEQAVLERTAELRESEARYRSLINLASDWHWEQDEGGRFTCQSGPIFEILGIQDDNLLGDNQDAGVTRWNKGDREQLHAMIAQRQPFLDFTISRIKADGTVQKYLVSGEPMFDQSARFVGYRGVGIELSAQNNLPDEGT